MKCKKSKLSSKLNENKFIMRNETYSSSKQISCKKKKKMQSPNKNRLK